MRREWGRAPRCLRMAGNPVAEPGTNGVGRGPAPSRQSGRGRDGAEGSVLGRRGPGGGRWSLGGPGELSVEGVGVLEHQRLSQHFVHVLHQLNR